MNDAIIQRSIVNDLHKWGLFVWNETHCQVSFRLYTTAFYDAWNFPQEFPRNRSNALQIRTIVVRAHPAVSTKQGSLQTRNFTVHYVPLWQSVRLHHSCSTNCYSHTSLITNFQPPPLLLPFLFPPPQQLTIIDQKILKIITIRS